MYQAKQIAKLSISDIHNEIYKKPENAYYTLNPFEIHPHVIGVDFAIDNISIEKILEEDDFEYSIPIKYTIPARLLSSQIAIIFISPK